MTQKRIRHLSPKGVAVFPRLNEPDTKFKAEGEYSVKLAYDPNDKVVKELITKLEAIRDEEFAKFVSENPKKKKSEVAPVFTEELDKDGDETGRILLNFKMRASGVSKKTKKPFTMKPDLFDALKRPLLNPPQIGSGSVLRVSFETSGSFVESAKKFYLSLRMVAVQVIDLVEFGVRNADSFGFEEEEDGFAADEEATTKAPVSNPKKNDAEGGDDAGDGEDDGDDGDY